MKFLKNLFYYVPPEPPPEVPREEHPDPNEDCSIPEPVRSARRNMMILCGISLAWSSAQFVAPNPSINILGVTLNLKESAIPVILGGLLIYATFRWIMEFAMMSRKIRRWPLAQLDFKISLTLAQLSLLSITAGALDRSLGIIAMVIASMAILALVSTVLSYALTFLIMPLRIRARARADRISAANAAIESFFWARLFAIILTVFFTTITSVASYLYTPLRDAIWQTPPNPVSYGIFTLTLILVFLSHWLLHPIMNRLFAHPPEYWTKRGQDGSLHVHFVHRKKEPLL